MIEAVTAMSVANTGKRLAKPLKGADKGPFILHSVKAVMITNNETVGFEPLALAMSYRIDDEEMN